MSHPAVNHHRFGGDVTRLFASKQRVDRGNFIRRTLTPERHDAAHDRIVRLSAAHVLRGPARTEPVGESFASPRDATSLEELELVLTQFEQRESRWVLIQRLAQRLTVPLEPDEIWLLVQLCRKGSAPLTAGLVEGLDIPLNRVDDIAERMTAKGLAARTSEGSLIATNAGRQEFESMVASYRNHLAQFLERWSPEEHVEVRAMLSAHARRLSKTFR